MREIEEVGAGDGILQLFLLNTLFFTQKNQFLQNSYPYPSYPFTDMSSVSSITEQHLLCSAEVLLL